MIRSVPKRRSGLSPKAPARDISAIAIALLRSRASLARSSIPQASVPRKLGASTAGQSADPDAHRDRGRQCRSISMGRNHQGLNRTELAGRRPINIYREDGRPSSLAESARSFIRPIRPGDNQKAQDETLATPEFDLELVRLAQIMPSTAGGHPKALVAQLEALVKSDQAAIETNAINYTKGVAPIAGRTGIRLVDAGNTYIHTPIVSSRCVRCHYLRCRSSAQVSRPTRGQLVDAFGPDKTVTIESSWLSAARRSATKHQARRNSQPICTWPAVRLSSCSWTRSRRCIDRGSAARRWTIRVRHQGRQHGFDARWRSQQDETGGDHNRIAVASALPLWSPVDTRVSVSGEAGRARGRSGSPARGSPANGDGAATAGARARKAPNRRGDQPTP